MATYLHSVGRDKVGFTIVDRKPDGSPRYVKGIRGAVERNVMRYYFASLRTLRRAIFLRTNNSRCACAIGLPLRNGTRFSCTSSSKTSTWT